jgi:L-2-hydroxyglutarate oxidase LhgO
MDHKFDITVIGGGIVGLATAMNMGDRFPNIRVAVLEKEHDVARHQTGHNSGVIHSGIYYRPGSLKAKNCVEGAAAMVRFCQEHGIRYESCGKVVVAATPTETPRLHELFRRGTTNGVANMTLIGPERLRELEPHAFGIEALHVPGTGITDYRAVANEYARLIQTSEGEILTDCRVMNVLQSSQSVVLETTRGAIESRFAINCAGLHSDRLMQLAGDSKGLRIIPFRGEYYEIAAARQNLVRNLIYPVADPNFPFLGVHFTRRIGGGVEAGRMQSSRSNVRAIVRPTSVFRMYGVRPRLAVSGGWPADTGQAVWGNTIGP